MDNNTNNMEKNTYIGLTINKSKGNIARVQNSNVLYSLYQSRQHTCFKILVLFDSSQEAYGGHEGKYPQD